MTARLIFEATLIELSKTQTPALKLQEFNYLFNKAINQYINKVYNTYDLNQQTTDDLRVLKATAYLEPKKWQENNSALHLKIADANSYLSRAHRSIQSLHGATYEVELPIDYLHLLNCVCIYYVAKQKDCWDAGSYIEIPAQRLTADSWSQIITDIYNRPSPMKPYYYIHNQNNQTNNAVLPTDPITKLSDSGMPNGTDMTGTYTVISNSDPVVMQYPTLKYTLYKAKMKNGKLQEDSKAYTKTGTLTIPASTSDGLDIYQNALGKFYASNLLNEESEIIGLDLSVVDLILVGNQYETSTVTTESYPAPEKTVATKENPNGSNFPRTFKLDLDGNGEPDTNVSLVEKPIGLRAGNTSNVRLEIRYGKDDTLFQLKEVQVDYVKSPQFIRLTQEQLDLTEDTSQIMEFPDYVNQEIINELVHLVMERVNDPRLSNNMQITQSIARPTGQLAQPAQAQAQA